MAAKAAQAALAVSQASRGQMDKVVVTLAAAPSEAAAEAAAHQEPADGADLVL